MLQKNKTYPMECTALGASFEGICRVDGQVVFVPGALPSETLDARIIKVTKRYAIGKLERLYTVAPDRIQPPCPYFPRCGGCAAQHLQYAATLAHKRRQVADCLERIGGFTTPPVAPTLGMEDPWRYRNKGAFPVGGMAGAPQIGMYAARSHAIIDQPAGCLLQTAQSDALVSAVRRWMTGCRIPPYDEMSHTGLVRHVMTREAADGSTLLLLIINGSAVPHGSALVEMTRAAAPGLRGVLLSENTRRTNVILGDRTHPLWGEDRLEDTVAGMRVQVSPQSFFQVNRIQADRLVALALEDAGLTGREHVWDLYCGAGTFTLPLAHAAAEVTGVEVVPEAIADAEGNARRNGIANASFVAGAVETVLPGLLRARGAPDVALLDPPRKGCAPEVLQALADAAPRRIVYVSCNPATLARDAGYLASHGYALQGVRPVDMFCWTEHVECVARMEVDHG